MKSKVYVYICVYVDICKYFIMYIYVHVDIYITQTSKYVIVMTFYCVGLVSRNIIDLLE